MPDRYLNKEEEKQYRVAQMQDLGKLIYSARTVTGMSQEELAQETCLNMSGVAVSKYENANQEMRVITFFEIAKALGVTPNDLCPPNLLCQTQQISAPKGYELLNEENRAFVGKMISALVMQQGQG